MTASFEKKGATQGTLTFTIERPLIEKGLQKSFNKMKGKVTVPGFRKGHITRETFVRLFGEETLYEEAVNAVLPEAYAAAVKEAGIEAVGQPGINAKSMEKGKDWVMVADTAIKPEVKLGDYENLSVNVSVTKEVTDEDVTKRLEAEQNRMAELVLKDGEAQNGDTVVIDFVGSIDGVEFEGGKGNNHSLELGSGQFIPGFEEQLVGHKAGDDVEVKVTFPEDYQAKDLAGKEALFATKIHEVKSKELPELDDELAKDIDENVATLEELKAKYRQELEASKEEEYTDALEDAVIEAAVKNATIEEIPQAMIDDEIHRAMNEFLGGMQQQGINPEMYYQLTGTTEEDLHKRYEGEAEQRVRTNLVIEAIAKAKDYAATPEEIEAEAANLAKDYNMNPEQVKRLLPDDLLTHDINMKKAVEALTSTAKVTYKPAEEAVESDEAEEKEAE